jgi:hypothetical protein
MLKIYPKSILDAKFPYSYFSEARYQNNEILLSLFVKDYLKNTGESGWLSEDFSKYFVTDVLLINDKKTFDSIDITNYKEIKKSVKVKTILNYFDVKGGSLTSNYENLDSQTKILNISYDAKFQVDFNSQNFIGFVCFTRINSEAYSLENPGTFEVLEDINNSSIQFDKYIFCNESDLNYKKAYTVYQEKGIEYLWYGKVPQETVTVQANLEFALKDNDFFKQTKNDYIILDNKKKDKNVFFSDLFYGIDENLNVKGIFFFDAYKYLKETSVVYKKLNKYFFSRDLILKDQNALNCFKFKKEFIKQNSLLSNNPSEKIEFSLNYDLEFNTDKGIKAIQFTDYNQGNYYLDKEFYYSLSLDLSDTIYIIAENILKSSQASLKNLKELRNYLYSNLYVIKNRQYVNYDFLNSRFKDAFLEKNKTTLQSFEINKILENYLTVDYILGASRDKKDIKFLKPFLDLEVCSFEDVETVLINLEKLVTRLDDILKSQKTGSVYKVNNIFKETIYLDSSLHSLIYSKPFKESDDYSFTYRFFSSINTLPLLSPYSILVRDFSDKGYNEKRNFIFEENLNKGVKDILSNENINFYDDLMRNMDLKVKFQKRSPIIKKTTNLNIDTKETERIKHKFLKDTASETYSKTTKKLKITSKEQFIQTTKELPKEEKILLYKKMFNKKPKTIKDAEDKIIDLSSKYYDSIYSQMINLKDEKKNVKVYENPYLSFLNQIQNGEVVKVEYISGFQENGDEILLKMPIWESLTADTYKEKTTKNLSTGKQSLCRISVNKVDNFLTSKKNIDLNLTILYKNFILSYK